MDLFSYLLGKQAGGGGGGNLQEKTVTIAEYTTTVLTPDAGYDGFSKVTVITQEPAPPKVLPDEYQGVTYIQSSGAQYINTNVNTSNDLKLEIDLRTVSIDAKGLYGGGIGWQNQYIQGEADSIAYFAYGNQTQSTNISSYTGQDIKVTQDRNKIKLNDVLLFSFNSSTFITTVPVVLFAVNRSGEISEHGYYAIKHCNIYKNDVLIRDFYPCYRKADGEIGLYDIVNSVFYTNQGTGTFSKGQDIDY